MLTCLDSKSDLSLRKALASSIFIFVERYLFIGEVRRTNWWLIVRFLKRMKVIYSIPF